MKAIYQNPTTEIITITVAQMIAISQFGDLVENGEDLGDAPTTDQTSGNLSRRRTVWDEEEEDF